MDEINFKIQELCFTGIKPKVLLLGLKQRKELRDSINMFVPEPFRRDIPKVASLFGFEMNIIDMPQEDFCEAHGNEKY